MIDHLRYTTWALIFIFAIVGGMSVDKHRRLSRVLRILAYTIIWIYMIVYSVIYGVVAFDRIQIMFVVLASLASLSISLYSEGYFRTLFGKASSLQTIIDSSLALLIMFYTAYNLLELTILWIAIEITGFLLIMIERGTVLWNIGMKYLIICATAGDTSLFTWIGVEAQKIGITNALLADFSTLQAYGVTAPHVITVLLVIGFLAKLAQIPLHIWLVDTYAEAPPVVTAIMSGLMSKMGVYGLLRIYNTVIVDKMLFMTILLIMGAVTIIYGSVMSAAQTNVKRMLAYSSMAHYGIMVILLSLMPVINYVKDLVIFYALYHGFVKTQLFLNTGTIAVLANTFDTRSLGYLSGVTPEIYNYIVIGVTALMGLPPTIGFMAKALVIITVLDLLKYSILESIILIVSVGIASIFSIVYSVKYLGCYIGYPTRRVPRPALEITSLQKIGEIIPAIAVIALPFTMLPLISFSSAINILLIIHILALVLLAISYSISPKIYKAPEPWLGGIEL